MRIVLTNAGKKEIILDEAEKKSIKYFHSEEKVKYSPKITVPTQKRESIKNQIKRFSIINDTSKSGKRLFTEAPLINAKKSLRKSLTNKIPQTLEITGEKKNSLKFINVSSSKILLPKQLNDIYSIKENVGDINNKGRKKNKFQIKQLRDGFSLPVIKNSVPLKDILLDKNAKNINNRILKKQISKNKNNLINYLKLDKTIKPSFIEKLNKADNDRLIKLDKICQKYFNDRKRNDLIQQNIQDKIKLEYSNDSKYCRENLINMQKDIQNYKKIYKSYFNLYHFKHNK